MFQEKPFRNVRVATDAAFTAENIISMMGKKGLIKTKPSDQTSLVESDETVPLKNTKTSWNEDEMVAYLEEQKELWLESAEEAFELAKADLEDEFLEKGQAILEEAKMDWKKSAKRRADKTGTCPTCGACKK